MVWGPGVVPLDSERNSVQNRGSFVSGAPTATPIVPKLIFWELAPKKVLKYARAGLGIGPAFADRSEGSYRNTRKHIRVARLVVRL